MTKSYVLFHINMTRFIVWAILLSDTILSVSFCVKIMVVTEIVQ